MKVLVVYDSLYGNTEKIAKAIGDAITGEVKVLPVGEVYPSEIKANELFVFGSPTHGGKPKATTRDFLNKITAATLEDVSIAAFDTRISTKLVGPLGYAAGRIADNLKGKGGTLVASPEGFFVKGIKGPLKEGELERAADWGKEVERLTGVSQEQRARTTT